jgi:hypothetical protein
MHRVVNMNSVGRESNAIKVHKSVIKNKLIDFSCHSSEVNDGDNGEGITLAGHAYTTAITQQISIYLAKWEMFGVYKWLGMMD